VTTGRWVDVCSSSELDFDRGVAALVGETQVAVFRVSPAGDLFAISNYDPFSSAFVLSRGIVGSAGAVVKVASPMYKHGFDLRTGAALCDPTVVLPTFAVRERDGRVEVAVP